MYRVLNSSIEPATVMTTYSVCIPTLGLKGVGDPIRQGQIAALLQKSLADPFSEALKILVECVIPLE